jgi:hypothetical protein
LKPSSTAGILVGIIATFALIAYLFHRYQRKRKVENQVLDNGMYFKAELSGKNKNGKIELSGDREIVELKTNERRQ